MIEIKLLIYLILTYLITKEARKLPLILRYIIYLQQIFMVIPFFLKPILLRVFMVAPIPMDNFSQPRLLQNGNYDAILNHLLTIILVTTFGYFLAVKFVIYLFIRDKDLGEYKPMFKVHFFLIPLLITLSLIAIQLSNIGITNPFLFPLQQFACSLTCFVVIFFDNISGSQRNKVLLILFGVSVTIFQVYSDGFSKSQVFSILFCIYISFMKRKESISKYIIVIISTPIALIIFNYMQQLKFDKNVSMAREFVALRYPEWFRPFYGVFERFDLLSSITDAYYSGIGQWLSLTKYLQEIFSASLWNFGFTGINFGQRWAIEISSASIPGNAYSGVSLSQGPAAEGYIVFGLVGCFIVTFVLITMVLSLYMNQYRNEFISIISIDFLTKNSIFEQGIIGNVEMFTNSIKVGLVYFFINQLTKKVNTSYL